MNQVKSCFSSVGSGFSSAASAIRNHMPEVHKPKCLSMPECTQAKEAGIASLAAISAGVVAVAILAIFAMQGYNLAGINSIATALGAGGAYGLLLAGIVAVSASAVLTVAMVQSYKEEARVRADSLQRREEVSDSDSESDDEVSDTES